MTLAEVKAIIQEQLPILIDDPAIRDFILQTVANHYAPKKETESNFERMMAKIDHALSEIRRINDENERKREESKAENDRKWEESNQKREEMKAESDRKWEESNRKWEEMKAESDRKWAESNRKWEEMKAEGDRRYSELLQEVRNTNRRIDTTLGAIGARWGYNTEASFRNTLKAILEESFGVQVLNVTEFDQAGEVFGKPDQIELDLIIKNGTLILCEIKSSMSKSDMLTFHKKTLFYQKLHNRIANRRIVTSPMIDEKALQLAKELGIETYSHADSASI